MKEMRAFAGPPFNIMNKDKYFVYDSEHKCWMQNQLNIYDECIRH